MSVRQKKNGSWVVEIYLPGTGKMHIKPRDFGMGPITSEKQARLLERKALTARDENKIHTAQETCDSFAGRWMDDFPRRSEATNQHNQERVKKFAADFKGRPMSSIEPTEARAWAKQNKGRVPALRAMFNDAVRDRICEHNPFAGLGFAQSRGRKDVVIPTKEEIHGYADRARDLWPDGFGVEFGAMILWAAYTTMRPGEIFNAKFSNLEGDVYVVDKQWHSKLGREERTKHGGDGPIFVPEPAREAVLGKPRRLNDDLMFRTRTGKRFTEGTLTYWWRQVEQTHDFYSLRHFGATYLRNVLELPSWVVAEQMRHSDGGRLVEELYAHPDRDLALERMRQAFRSNARSGDQQSNVTRISGDARGTAS